MASAQDITLQRILRRSAQFARSHAPGLFQRVAANRFLRAAYRRVASPRLTSSVAYVSSSSNSRTDKTSASTDLARCLNLEMTKWAPGKRIDA
jgi:hypothetical protein